MTNETGFRALGLTLLALCSSNGANAQAVLTGDTRLACEAILCLSTGQRPTECAPAINRYYSIKHKKWSDTIKARRNFLDLCPAGNAPDMASRKESILAGAGHCDATSLNATLVTIDPNSGQMIIDNNLPNYCSAYINHAYSYKLQVTYVGNPLNGGYWEDNQ